MCDYAAILSSTSHAIPRAPWGGLAPPVHVVRDTRSFASWARFAFALVITRLGTWLPWDKAEGLLQHLLGLVPCLPLARSELHYEHCAPQNYPLAEGRSTAPEWVRALARLSPHV